MAIALKKSTLLAALVSHFPPGQFGRYLLVGLWNTFFGYATFFAFTILLEPVVPHGLGYIVASAVSGLLSITAAFLAYKKFVFKTMGNYLREWLRCLAVYGSNILLNLMLLPLLVEAIRHTTRYDYQAPFIAGALLTCMGVVYNFVGHRKFSFRNPA
jgi:putative flippase GtrA